MSEPKELPEGAAPKKSKKILIIALVAVLAVGGGGAGAFVALNKPGDAAETAHEAPKKKKRPPVAAEAEEATDDADEDEYEEADPAAPPVYAPLETFTVNLADGEHYLQLEVKVKVKEAKDADALKSSLPAIQHEVLLLLSAKTAEELRHSDGKKALAAEMKKLVTKVVRKRGLVKDVLFTRFVIQ